MACELTLKGSLSVPGSGCGSGSGGCGSDTGSSKTVSLSFSCAGQQYQAIRGSDCVERIQTLGAPGSQFVDLPSISGLTAIEFLYLKTSNPLIVRVGAAPATQLGSGGVFPTGFTGGEIFVAKFDGVNVAVTFTAGAQTAQQVANQVNAAGALAGLAFAVASVATTGQILLTGALTGPLGSIVVTTPNAVIGFAATGTTVGGGVDTYINGVYMVQFDKSNAPSLIQVSGSAGIEVLAAGTST